jgi:Gas vesicle synthesis protein GvpL/GvpF
MIYLYAFVDDALAGLPACRGHAEAPVQSMTRGSVTAIFSVHDQLDIRYDTRSLQHHDKVVTALMETCTVAPARFGSTLADVDRLEAVLAEQAPRLAPVLTRLRGASELAVRARCSDTCSHELPVPDVGPPSSLRTGRAYLRTRQRQSGNQISLPSPLVRFHDRLTCHAQAWTVGSRPDSSMVGAYLVASGEIEAFRDDFVAARARHPQLRVSLTGPWAPYSFVEPEALIDG